MPKTKKKKRVPKKDSRITKEDMKRFLKSTRRKKK